MPEDLGHQVGGPWLLCSPPPNHCLHLPLLRWTQLAGLPGVPFPRSGSGGGHTWAAQGNRQVNMPFQPWSVSPWYPGVLCGPKLMPLRAGKLRQRQYLSPGAHSSISWLPLAWDTSGVLSLTLPTSSSSFYFVLNFQSLWKRSAILIPPG